jgi:hypothetical protein
VSFLHEYVEILTDPAHAAAELTFFLVDLLLLSPGFLYLRRRFRREVQREHAVIDAEHGVEHSAQVGKALPITSDAQTSRRLIRLPGGTWTWEDIEMRSEGTVEVDFHLVRRMIQDGAIPPPRKIGDNR